MAVQFNEQSAARCCSYHNGLTWGVGPTPGWATVPGSPGDLTYCTNLTNVYQYQWLCLEYRVYQNYFVCILANLLSGCASVLNTYLVSEIL